MGEGEAAGRVELIPLVDHDQVPVQRQRHLGHRLAHVAGTVDHQPGTAPEGLHKCFHCTSAAHAQIASEVEGEALGQARTQGLEGHLLAPVLEGAATDRADNVASVVDQHAGTGPAGG